MLVSEKMNFYYSGKLSLGNLAAMLSVCVHYDARNRAQ